MARGKVYPAGAAGHLVNPLRSLVQPPERIVRRMHLPEGGAVLELGCGPGWFSPSIAAAVDPGRFTICDLQSEMLELALARCGSRARPHAVRASSMLGETGDLLGCLGEIARVLSPTGVVTIVETRRDSDFIRISDLTAAARETGLVRVARFGNRWEYTANFSHAARPASPA